MFVQGDKFSILALICGAVGDIMGLGSKILVLVCQGWGRWSEKVECAIGEQQSKQFMKGR